MVDPLISVYKKHDEWIAMVQRFGCNKNTAEDIVMEMYIKIKKRLMQVPILCFRKPKSITTIYLKP